VALLLCCLQDSVAWLAPGASSFAVEGSRSRCTLPAVAVAQSCGQRERVRTFVAADARRGRSVGRSGRGWRPGLPLARGDAELVAVEFGEVVAAPG